VSYRKALTEPVIHHKIAVLTAIDCYHRRAHE
jgi:hypothetical protein